MQTRQVIAKAKSMLQMDPAATAAARPPLLPIYLLTYECDGRTWYWNGEARNDRAADQFARFTLRHRFAEFDSARAVLVAQVRA